MLLVLNMYRLSYMYQWILSPVRLPLRHTRKTIYLLCSLGFRALQVISKFIFLALIFYILYILYKKVATKVATVFLLLALIFNI